MKKILIAALFILVLCVVAPARADYIDPLIQNSAYSGYIDLNGGIYTRILTTVKCLEAGGPPTWRGFMQWDTTSIPDNATITSVTLTLDQTTSPPAISTDIHAMANKPSTASDVQVYTDAGAGVVYGTIPFADSGATIYTLTAQAATDLDANLAANWFAVGFTNAGAWASILSNTTCIVTVRYYYMGVYYTLNPARYENNVLVGAMNVTFISSDGVDTVALGASAITVGFTNRPYYMSYNVTTGYYRRLYLIANTGSLTPYIPEASFAVFTPYVRDYTGITQDELTFLVTSRAIGGSDQIVERVPITNTINGIPVLLTVNRVYTLTVDTSVTDYAYSFYSSTSMGNPVILLDHQVFTEVLQFNTRYIHVDASRPTTTSIQWDYLDDTGNTLNVTLNAKTMGGIILHTHNIPGSSSFTYTWAGATNTTDIIAEALITHSDFGNLTYRRPFGGAYVLPVAPPSLVGLGSFGGIAMSQVFGATIILAIAGLFSTKNAAAGLIICAIMAAALSYYGFIAINTGLIVFVMGIALFYEMGRAKT